MHWVVPGSKTKRGYVYRPLRIENDFKEFILKILGNRFMYIYIEHKFEEDKGLGDAVEPRNT